MAVKKTISKKATTTVAQKPATKKVVKPVESSVKKDSIIHKPAVEVKRTDKCECGENCKCNCCCSCGIILKLIILILLLVNLAVSCFFMCKKSAYSLEALKLGGKENLEKVVDKIYKNEVYIQAQKDQINAYLEQIGEN